MVVLLERCNKVRIKNRICPFLVIVSKGCIITDTMSFHNDTKKRNRLGTNLCSRINIQVQGRIHRCALWKGHVKSVAVNL